MKILEIISSLKAVGGGETFAVNISRSFHKFAELKVVILYKDYTQMFIDRLKEKCIDFVLLDKKKHFDLKNAKQLKAIIEDFSPDVIHTENNSLIPTYLALKMIHRKKRIPVFHTLHLIPEMECPSPIVRLLYKHIFKIEGFTPVALSEELAERTKRFFKLSSVPFVKNGIDFDKIPLETKALEDRTFDVAVVGRFSREKNHKFLVESFVKIKQQIPSFKAVFIGGGELFDDVKNFANQKKADYIDFLGIHENPSMLLLDAKIIALGSLYEANPLSLIEGMAVGCIPVSSDVGGVKDIVKKENGFLYSVGNQDEFVIKTVDILKNINIYTSMSENNRAYSKKFSIDNSAKLYMQLMNLKIKNEI